MKTSILLTIATLGVSTIAGSAQDAPRRPLPPQGPRVPPIMAALDGNHDGRLDATEIGNASQSLKRLDGNKDGELSGTEFSFRGRHREPQNRRDVGRKSDEVRRPADRINQPKHHELRIDDRTGTHGAREGNQIKQGDGREHVEPRDNARRPSDSSRGLDGPRDLARQPGDDRHRPHDARRPEPGDRRSDGPHVEMRRPRDSQRHFDAPRDEVHRPNQDRRGPDKPKNNPEPRDGVRREFDRPVQTI